MTGQSAFRLYRSRLVPRALVDADDGLWRDLLAVLSRADLRGWPDVQGFREALEEGYIRGPGTTVGAGREA